MPNSIDQTNTQFFHFHNEEAPFELRCRKKLTNFTLAYEMYGQMSQNKDNVILLFHALSASQNAAGFTEKIEGLSIEWDKECQTGWWNDFIGPGKALDTDKYCVICANYLGGCYGSTGPSSINPETGKPFGGLFPRISIKDIVNSCLLYTSPSPRD